MPKKRVIKSTGSKEAPLAVVGSSDVVKQLQQEQSKFYIPDDTEYKHYIELLRGYFKKFTRWQEIFENKKYFLASEPGNENGYWENGFRLSQTPQGLIICTSGRYEYLFYADPSQARQDTAMYAEMAFRHDPPDKEGKYGLTTIDMGFHEGAAGKQLFIDPDGKSLQSVRIGIHSFWSDTWSEVTISALYPYPRSWSSESELEPTQGIKFVLRESTLQVSKVVPKMKNTVLMAENYATTLLNTIDSLIPGSTSSAQQNERRDMQATQTPKAIPPARRKPRR